MVVDHVVAPRLDALHDAERQGLRGAGEDLDFVAAPLESERQLAHVSLEATRERQVHAGEEQRSHRDMLPGLAISTCGQVCAARPASASSR